MGQKVKSDIEKFKKNVPLLVSLKKEGMGNRHWQEIKEKTGIKVEVSE